MKLCAYTLIHMCEADINTYTVYMYIPYVDMYVYVFVRVCECVCICIYVSNQYTQKQARLHGEYFILATYPII